MNTEQTLFETLIDPKAYNQALADFREIAQEHVDEHGIEDKVLAVEPGRDTPWASDNSEEFLDFLVIFPEGSMTMLLREDGKIFFGDFPLEILQTNTAAH